MRGHLPTLFNMCSVLFALMMNVRGQFVEEYEGNVHLIDGDSSHHSSQGVLQVYTQDQWTTVCYSINGAMVTNEGAAAAACRQRGYINHTQFNTASELGFDYPGNLELNAISGIRCPEVKLYREQGEIFLLRCDYGKLVSNMTCDGVVAVQCNQDVTDQSSYNGQVQLYLDTHKINKESSHPSSLLGIYHNNEWLPICTNHMNNVSANSACRQMGFTHSIQAPISSNDRSRSLKINSLSNCDPSSYTSLPCFTDCINQSSGVTVVEHCDLYQYEVICRFDPNLALVRSSGSQFTCSYPTTGSTDVPLEIVGGVTGGLSLVILLLVCTIVFLVCRRPNGDNGPRQPFYVRCWRRRYGAVDNHRDRDDN